jgi:transcriptional regulator with XRE-family HTH domain
MDREKSNRRRKKMSEPTELEDPDPAESFGRAIQLRRTQLGMSRRDFAIEAGLSYPYVCEMEKGQKEPSAKARRQLLNALRLDPVTLASWTELAETPEESPSSLPTADSSRPLEARTLLRGSVDSWSSMPSRLRQWSGPSSAGRDVGAEHLIADLVAGAVRAELARWTERELPDAVRAEVEAAMRRQEP